MARLTASHNLDYLPAALRLCIRKAARAWSFSPGLLDKYGTA